MIGCSNNLSSLAPKTEAASLEVEDIISQLSQFVVGIFPIGLALWLGWRDFWVFLPTTDEENPMNPIVFRADVISPSVPLHPFEREIPFILGSPEPVVPGSAEPNRPPIRHLLIGVPEVVQLTIHRLHQVGYAEAGLWSTAIGLSSPQLTLTVNPGEVMRVLRRSP